MTNPRPRLDKDEAARRRQMERRIRSFTKAARPLIRWLADNVHPHHAAHVTSTGAELFEGSLNTGRVLDYLTD